MQSEKGVENPLETKGRYKYQEEASSRAHLGKERRAVKLGKLFIGHWRKSIWLPVHSAF